jgi:hypothetical protein
MWPAPSIRHRRNRHRDPRLFATPYRGEFKKSLAAALGMNPHFSTVPEFSPQGGTPGSISRRKTPRSNAS